MKKLEKQRNLSHELRPLRRTFAEAPLFAQLEFQEGIDWKAPHENTSSEQTNGAEGGEEGREEGKGGTCINIRGQGRRRRKAQNKK